MTTKQQAQMLADKGLRPTPQRLAVYDYLLSHPTHPTVDTIYQALLEQYPTFSRTTIYNSVKALCGAGLIRLVGIDPEEQRFDGNPQDHGHFQCSRCGRILDFPLPEEFLRDLCPPGCEATIQDVFLHGLCPACASQTHAKP